jgi:hypothetical protein
MPQTGIAPEILRGLRESLHGTLICPGDEDYEAARRVWNRMIDRQPTLIVRCADAADVIKAVQSAQAERLPLSVRGGGHSVGSLAVCDQGMMIDLSRMKGLQVDPGSCLLAHTLLLEESVPTPLVPTRDPWKKTICQGRKLDGR